MTGAGTVQVIDAVSSPSRPPAARLRDQYFAATERLTLGLVRYRDRAFGAGPVPLIRFGEAEPTSAGWRFPLRGGALLAEPGGELEIGWREGSLEAAVRGYRPALPLPLYRVTQLAFHHLQTRLALLAVRGRQPAPGVPAAPSARLAAGALDAALCLLLAGRRPRRAPAIAAAYHLAAWRLGGRTLGGLLLHQRVVSVDGSPLTLGQAAVRLAALPFALLRLRAVHDAVAGTEVVGP